MQCLRCDLIKRESIPRLQLIVGCHQKISEVTIADAVLDRIIHNSYEIFIGGRGQKCTMSQ
jgi:hypothetical protein